MKNETIIKKFKSNIGKKLSSFNIVFNVIDENSNNIFERPERHHICIANIFSGGNYIGSINLYSIEPYYSVIKYKDNEIVQKTDLTKLEDAIEFLFFNNKTTNNETIK